MLIKMNVQKETSFSNTKPRAFSRDFHFEKKGHLTMYFHRRPHCQTQEQIISLPRKKIAKELQDFKKKQIVLDSHRINFGFQNARSRFQD
jgi:hypothetical protein